MGSTVRQYTSLPYKPEQGIVAPGPRSLQESLEFARIQPQTAAPVAEIDVDVLEPQAEEWDITFRTDAFHGSRRRGDDDAHAGSASSTSHDA